MVRSCAALVLLIACTSSCAYYNTYYLAKRYYTTATEGLPYAVEKPNGTQTGNYQKAIDYSKKVIASYPKSKWVDDAYLMWAQSLLGKEDPLQTVTMLLDYHARFPVSPRTNESTFYLGVAYRQGRKPREALVALDEFLQKAPKHPLVPYAHLERARALMTLNRPAEAAQAASQVIDGYPGSPLVIRARATRAEASLAGGDPVGARKDFEELGFHAVDDQQRFEFLLREADCLEAARDYDTALDLLTTALSHEPAPVKTPSGAAPTGPGVERYGQLTLRVGTVHLLAGRSERALTAYKAVIQDYPKTALAAEAQYRIGYTFETVLDDFTTARQEYAKVRDQSVGSAFFTQATERQQSLDRLERFRSAGADSVDRQVEAGFLLAEQYLFQLDKPDRALEAYAGITRDHPGTPAAGKALNAQAWVLRRKLDRPAEADSLLWVVVHDYPATEAQLAARDYLEAAGHMVPAELIQIPGALAAALADTTTEVADSTTALADSTTGLTRPPEGTAALGTPAHGSEQLGPGAAAVAGAGALHVPPPAADTTLVPPPAIATPSLADTTAHPPVVATTPVHPDTSAAPRPIATAPVRADSSRTQPKPPAPPAHPDTPWAPR